MDFDQSVVDIDTPAPVVPDKGQGKDKDEKVTLSKAEFDALKRDRDEATETSKYWANLARSGGAPRQDRAEEQDDTLDASEFIDAEEGDGGDPDDTPEKMVDELAAQGVKALSKRGFITKADAVKIATEAALKVSQVMIARERNKVTSETEIMTEFPDLKDQKSALYKATAKNYQDAVRIDPNATKTPAALFLAAKLARAELKAQELEPDHRSHRNENHDYDNYRPESEADRRQRANSQDSRPRGRAAVDDDDDMIGDEARQVMKAMGISEDEFNASKKQYGDGSRSRSGRR